MAAAISKVALGSQGFEVSPQGLGCMGMSLFAPLKPDEEIIELIRKAVENGITFLDTSNAYGPYTNEILVGKAIKGIRDKVEVGTKFSLFLTEAGTFEIRGDPENVRSSCEGSLERLGVDCIDLFYQHRVDSKVPIEITMGELKKLVDEGKIKYIGLSEASAADIRRAHAVHPITAVQIEYSLWTRDVEEDIIPTCRELGIGIVSYSPLGQGFFSGKQLSDLTENDFRKNYLPRFTSENFQQNRRFYEKLVKIGEDKKCTPGQLALAWVQHKGVVPIPGTTKWKNLEENMGSLNIKLTPEDILSLEDAVPCQEVKGDRCGPAQMTSTWRFTNSLRLDQWTGTRQ